MSLQILPENVRLGERTAQIGGRNVLLLPPAARSAQTMRDWGKPDEAVDVPALLAGRLNSRALQYVDVGGKADQSLYAGSDVEYDLTVPAGGLQLDFIAAPPQASVPQPNEMAWTPEKLRQAARDVWRDWR